MDLYKPLVALLAIVNPIGVIPFFIHFTNGFTRQQRQRTARVAARFLFRKRLKRLYQADARIEQFEQFPTEKQQGKSHARSPPQTSDQAAALRNRQHRKALAGRQ